MGQVFVGAGPRACPTNKWQQTNGQPQGVAPTTMSLSDIVHRFKTLTTKQYTDEIKINHVSCPRNSFWNMSMKNYIITILVGFAILIKFIILLRIVFRFHDRLGHGQGLKSRINNILII